MSAFLRDDLIEKEHEEMNSSDISLRLPLRRLLSLQVDDMDNLPLVPIARGRADKPIGRTRTRAKHLSRPKAL